MSNGSRGQGASTRQASTRPGSRRALQVGFVVAALAAVGVGEAMADALVRLWGAEPAVITRLASRVVAGWAVGTALRMELAPRARPHRLLRRLLGIPLGVVAVWPVLLALLPGETLAAVPPALRGHPAQAVATFAAGGVGVVLALAVRRSR